ncbi:transketolase [Hypericibacter terrae]|uniref:Transketolase n=1 Tax=Hypericibacter terrae TaxID=2602015 RepID=A0A5J6MDC3_9PROT|nr:transketolase [Hypericibacter terrae]QEX15071.1 transketolase [Hypericibacter terrae]
MPNPRRSNSFDLSSARQRCRRYRRRILDISQQVSALHVAPAFSCTEITDAIYHGLMRRAPDGSFQDVFLMSKGHGCMIQYVILEELGILTREDLDLYCTPRGRLGAHPDFGTPGIAASTGSLGHGLGIATGQACAERMKGSDVLIYCVLSDGEFQEGSTWEAMMMAANLKLPNLIAFMDNNDFSGLERMSEGHQAFYPLIEKIDAFGWETAEVDGHNGTDIFNAVTGRRGDRPLLVVCHTVKGKGVSFMEHVPVWHYRSPNAAELKQAIAELEKDEA